MGATVDNNIEGEKTTLIQRQIYHKIQVLQHQCNKFTELYYSQLIRVKELFPSMSHFRPLKVHSTDFNYFKHLATERENDSKMLSKSQNIVIDLRTSIIYTNLLSPTALIIFREISREKSQMPAQWHLLDQIYGDQAANITIKRESKNEREKIIFY